MNIKTVWVYDEDGFFEDTHIAQPNPRRPGSWLFPPRATTVKPAMEAKVFYKIKDPTDTDSEWEAIPYPAGPEDFVGLEISHQSRTQRSETLRKWLRKFVADQPELWREKQINDEDGNLQAITIEAIPQPTAEELLEKKSQEIRAKRDYYLQLTDYLVVNDYPITENEREQVLAYRQFLRDLPQAQNFPENIEWPEPPTVAKAAHKVWKSNEMHKEIQIRITTIQQRSDLNNEQKTAIVEQLHAVAQQPGFPYEIVWPDPIPVAV